VAPGLPRHPVAKLFQALREFGTRNVARQPHAAITSSRVK
jgi:hypothetical protein